MRNFLKAGACLIFACASFTATAQQKYFQDWPENADPHTVGDRVAIHFLESAHLNPIVYPEVCAWYGALKYAEATNNPALEDQLQARYRPLLTPQFHDLIPDKEHVDYEIFGAVPLQISIETKDSAARAVGLHFADRQWSNPQPDGLSGETRFWIDDMYMLTILQLQAYRATDDTKYLDRAANEMVAYLDKLQQPNGLFYHAPDVPFFWGRGDGWVAAGMTEMLQLPCPPIIRSAREILAGYQQNDGRAAQIPEMPMDMWRQLIDHPEAWEESVLHRHVHLRA